MAPASFCARGASSARTSSIEARPPEAMTGNRQRVGERDGGVEIEAFEHAVARDIGVDDGGNAGILEAARDVRARSSSDGLRPAFDRHLAVARIEPDGDAAGMSARRLLDQAPGRAPPRCR